METFLPKTVTVKHVLSRQERELEVGEYVNRSITLLWPLDKPIEIRITKDGLFTSKPLSFLKSWTLTKQSQDDIRHAIRSHQEAFQEKVKEERYVKRSY